MIRNILITSIFALTTASSAALASSSNIIPVQWPGVDRDHCARMRDRMHEMRDRMDYAPPWERERMRDRMGELRDRMRYECWGR